jgi:hypothetical protein
VATLPTVAKTNRCDLIYNDGIANFGSRFFFYYGVVSPDEGDQVTLAGEIKGVWVDNMAPLVSQRFALVEVRCTDLNSDTGAVGSWTGSESGTITGDYLSSNLSSDMDMAISSRYRGGHPVMHFPPPSADELTSARQWSSDFVGDFNTGSNNFLQAVNGLSLDATPLEWLILRGYRSGVEPDAVSPFPVNSTSLRQYIGTMRKRARALR